MVKKLNLIEIIFLVIILVVFSIVIYKYRSNSSFKKLWSNRTVIMLTINSEIDYWKYILNHSKYFPGSKILFDNWSFTIGYNVKSSPEISENIDGIPVLLYHGVSEYPKAEDINKEEFLQQMIALKKAGYKTISINEFQQYIDKNKKLDNKSVLITFDDGRKDSYYNSDSILRALDYRAVIFVISDHSLKTKNSRYYLNKNELLNMTKSGRWDIQSHGDMDHYAITINANGDNAHFMGHKQWLPSVNRIETNEEFIQRLTKDLLDSKNNLESVINEKVISYAFPYGDFGQYGSNSIEIENIVKKIVTQIYPISFIQFRSEKVTGYYRFTHTINADDKLYKRILVSKYINVDEFMNILYSGNPKSLPFYFDNINEKWITDSSMESAELKNANTILIKTLPTRNSASAYLDGSFHWKDYKFTSEFLTTNTTQVSLIGRDIDGRNYVSCVYGQNQVYLNETDNGVTRIIAKYRGLFNVIQGTPLTLTIKFNGNLVGCYRNDQKLVESFIINPLLNHGGIGYKIWGINPGEAQSQITNIYVETQ